MRSFTRCTNGARRLPRFFWDFTRPWSEPVWDDQPAIRQQFGLCKPSLLTAENCVPCMVNLDGVKAAVKVAPASGGVRIQIEIDVGEAALAVAGCRLESPAASGRAESASKRPINARFIPIVDGSTENLYGLVVCEKVLPGKNIRTVRLQGAASPARRSDPPYRPARGRKDVLT